MIGVIANIWISFLAGLFAPLGAVCVLPLYPGFLAFLSNQIKDSKSQRKTAIILGLLVTAGVIISMFLFGLIFVAIFGTSLTKVIGIISPIAFGIMAIVSIMLIFNFNFSRLLPKVKTPEAKNPYINALLFGAFFGLIILPCNPASLTVLFAISSSTIGFLTNLLNFFMFGVGMGIPLFVISILSVAGGRKVTGFLIKHTRVINIIAGVLMLVIAIYYLFFVFKIFG